MNKTSNLSKESKKHILIFTIAMLSILSLYLILKKSIDNHVQLKHLYNGGHNMSLQIGDIKQDKTICISGTFIMFGQDSTSYDELIEVYLYDAEKNKIIRSVEPTEFMKNDDSNTYYNCDYDYSNIEFVTNFNKRVIDLEKGNYEFIVLNRDKNHLYKTNVYLCCGEVMNANPMEYQAIVTENTELKDIITNGRLVSFSLKYLMWLYEYKGSLFWIWEKDICDANKDEMSVFLHVFTTCPELLPSERVQHGFESLDFRFANREVIETEKYRVAKFELNRRYPVSIIQTGLYNGEFLWSVYFAPQIRELVKVNE